MSGVGVPNSPDVFNLHTNMYTRVLGQGDRCGWLAMASKETSSEIGVLSGGGFDFVVQRNAKIGGFDFASSIWLCIFLDSIPF